MQSLYIGNNASITRVHPLQYGIRHLIMVANCVNKEELAICERTFLLSTIYFSRIMCCKK